MKIEKTIDRESKLKLYVQIYSIIKEKIESGEWSAGEQIPTEDDLCKSYDVSKVTVREAIQELAREGYLRRQQGKGTFVLYPVRQSGLAVRMRLSDILHEGEGAVRKEMLEKGPVKPSGDVKAILQAQAQYFLIKEYVDGEPAALDEIFLPISLIPVEDEESILRRSFPDIIEEKSTKKISRVIQTCWIRQLERDLSLHLGMKEGAPALVVGREFIGADGDPVGFARYTIRNGIKVRMELERIR